MRIARHGWVVIARSLVAAAVALLLTRWPGFSPAAEVLAVLALASAGFAAYFFRDPDRPLPEDPDTLYATGDGRVLSIAHEGLGAEVTVRVFLSIFNVHIQRAPCAGTVQDAEYIKGSFRAAMAAAARGNERCVLRIQPEGREQVVVVEQIAGLIARRIECWVGQGDRVAAGQRYGMIHYGSQVAMTLPAEAQVLVSVGDRVEAGITPLARWTDRP